MQIESFESLSKSTISQLSRFHMSVSLFFIIIHWGRDGRCGACWSDLISLRTDSFKHPWEWDPNWKCRTTYGPRRTTEPQSWRNLWDSPVASVACILSGSYHPALCVACCILLPCAVWIIWGSYVSKQSLLSRAQRWCSPKAPAMQLKLHHRCTSWHIESHKFGQIDEVYSRLLLTIGGLDEFVLVKDFKCIHEVFELCLVGQESLWPMTQRKELHG